MLAAIAMITIALVTDYSSTDGRAHVVGHTAQLLLLLETDCFAAVLSAVFARVSLPIRA